jgi:hypothetical protein
MIGTWYYTVSYPPNRGHPLGQENYAGSNRRPAHRTRGSADCRVARVGWQSELRLGAQRYGLYIPSQVAMTEKPRLSPLSESGWLSVDQTLIGNVAKITVAAIRNVRATPIKIH